VVELLCVHLIAPPERAERASARSASFCPGARCRVGLRQLSGPIIALIFRPRYIGHGDLSAKENVNGGTPNQAPLGFQQKYLQSTAFGGVVWGLEGRS